MEAAISPGTGRFPDPHIEARAEADFQTDLKEVARALRASLAAMVASVGLDPKDPQSLTRQWGVNKKLSWKISKIVQTEDPFLSLQHLPGSEGVEILLKKGKAAGVAPKYVQATMEAVHQFDRLVEVHCGDRATFEIMGSDLSAGEVGGPGRQQQELNRKQFFQGASSIWGAQARVNLKIRVVSPSDGAGPAAGKVDQATVGGLIDFRRLRENLPWVLFSRGGTNDDGTPALLHEAEPLDPNATVEGVPLMLDFCSKPVPPLNVIRKHNFVATELAPGPVGNAGVVSSVFGGIERSLDHCWTERDQSFGHMISSNVPAEVLIFDFYVHESITYALRPTVVFPSLLGPVARGGLEHDRYLLPLNEPLIELGSASIAPVTSEVPNYADILDTVFTRTGWNRRAFRGFRIKMAYPAVPAMLVMKYPLPRP
jgi:hypothetical protein